MIGIEIDDEVYRFLQSKARPFVDTPNTVLRRLLLTPNDTHGYSGMDARFPEIRKGTPDGLGQILEVVYLVRKGYAKDRATATRMVADKHQVKVPTVIDKYTRQLGHRLAADMNRMLDELGYSELMAVLKERFPDYSRVIDTFFAGLQSPIR